MSNEYFSQNNAEFTSFDICYNLGRSGLTPVLSSSFSDFKFELV